jgi:hypothetical protein
MESLDHLRGTREGEVTTNWYLNCRALIHSQPGLNFVEEAVRVNIKAHPSEITENDLARRPVVDVRGRGTIAALRPLGAE